MTTAKFNIAVHVVEDRRLLEQKVVKSILGLHRTPSMSERCPKNIIDSWL